MRAIGVVVDVLAITGLVGCSTLSVSSDWDREVDFSRYATFNLMPSGSAMDPFIRQRLEAAVIGEMEAKGLRRAGEKADLLVALHGRVDSRTQIDTVGFGYGVGRWGYWGRYGALRTATTTVREIPVGTLVIDIVDARQMKLAWQGVGTDTLESRSTPERSEKRINEAVKAILASFPPSAK
ncbi:MAG: DUF4136 domain-containing protein [Acidobacteriota bacterium]